jgi:hypothetical protein
VNTLTNLAVKDEAGVSAVLDKLRNSENPLNWVMFRYFDRDTLEMCGSGEGGLDELRKSLVENEIRFVILEVVITGDDYNAVKFVLITYIGQGVSAGIGKARAAGHRQELVDFVKKTMAISAEYQASNLDELNSREISASVTKVRERYQDSISVGQPKDVLQTMSRSHASAGDRTKSQLIINNEDQIKNELLRIHSTDELDWVMMTYEPGKKDEIRFQDSGKTLASIRSIVNDSLIAFILMKFRFVEPTQTVMKNVLITWVGENVSPLQKARTGSQRSELADWIIQSIPFHSHYQAGSLDELTEEAVFFKLRT